MHACMHAYIHTYKRIYACTHPSYVHAHVICMGLQSVALPGLVAHDWVAINRWEAARMYAGSVWRSVLTVMQATGLSVECRPLQSCCRLLQLCSLPRADLVVPSSKYICGLPGIRSWLHLSRSRLLTTGRSSRTTWSRHPE